MLKKILILALLFVPLLSSAQSKSNFNIIINVNQEIAINENLEFSYSIKSNTNQDIQYIPKIECPNAPQAMLGVIDLSLKADEEHKDDYFSMKVFKFIEPQECIAIINIIKPFKQTEEKKFKIITNSSLDIGILLCKDKECIKKSRVYKTGEILFLDYKTKVADIKSKANITMPDNSIQQIDLPNNIVLDQVGIYKIIVNSKANNYKDNMQSFEVTVLEGEIKVNNKRICNADGICSNQETAQNCPQDCVKAQQTINKINLKIIISIIVIAVVMGIMILAYLFLIKPRNVKGDKKDDVKKLD